MSYTRSTNYEREKNVLKWVELGSHVCFDVCWIGMGGNLHTSDITVFLSVK